MSDKPTDPCNGACRHERKNHVVRFRRPDGSIELGCSACDCACSRWVEPDKKVKV